MAATKGDMSVALWAETRELEAALAVSREEQNALQKELEVRKADIASKAAGAKAKQQMANDIWHGMTAEVKRLQAVCAAEAQRADAAETAATASQEEAERMRSGEADAMKQAKEALAVLTHEQRALQAELGQFKADFTSKMAKQEQLARIRADLDRLQSAHMAESQRADAAETAAKDRQGAQRTSSCQSSHDSRSCHSCHSSHSRGRTSTCHSSHSSHRGLPQLPQQWAHQQLPQQPPQQQLPQ